jgi:hypothetical protein
MFISNLPRACREATGRRLKLSNNAFVDSPECKIISEAVMKFIMSKTKSLIMLLVIVAVGASTLSAQSVADVRARRVNAAAKTSAATTTAPLYESARSDKFTGGEVPRAKFVAGESDVRITVDVPAFRLNFWQAGKVVSTYPIGIGLFDFQVPVGSRSFRRSSITPRGFRRRAVG